MEFPRPEDGLGGAEAKYWEACYDHPDFQYEWNNGIMMVRRDFVLRDYQLERQRAKAPEQRIEEPAAKLRALGVKP